MDFVIHVKITQEHKVMAKTAAQTSASTIRTSSRMERTVKRATTVPIMSELKATAQSHVFVLLVAREKKSAATGHARLALITRGK